MNTKQIAERLREALRKFEDISSDAIISARSSSETLARSRESDVVIRAMLEAADLLERMAWVPVSERLPNVDAYVMTWNGDRRAIDKLANKATRYWESYRMDALFRDEGDPFMAVTHWMPLPNPPGE